MVSMFAAVGDRLIVLGVREGVPPRDGEIIEVRHADGTPPYVEHGGQACVLAQSRGQASAVTQGAGCRPQGPAWKGLSTGLRAVSSRRPGSSAVAGMIAVSIFSREC